MIVILIKMSATKLEVSSYYNNFTEKQKKIGISVRHRIIYQNLKKIGLKANSNVLEIGCGIGTVSYLMIKHIKNGQFVGCDISEKSIEIAKINNQQKHAEFICTDMSDFTHSIKFDFVVFPDVLEHIPVEQHLKLFENVSKVCGPNAKLLINIPEPSSLNWMRKNKPELLQIIDQSLSMQDLMNNTYPNGFLLESLMPYSIHTNVNNYVNIVFVKNALISNYDFKSKLKNFIFNLKFRFQALLK